MAEKLTIKNQSGEKLLLIIEAMANSGSMRLQDIAEAVDIPPSTTLRYVNTLVSLGYIVQDPLNLRYALTLKLTKLGYQIASNIPIRDIARPMLIDLSKFCEEACCLTEEQDMEVLYIDVIDNHDNNIRFIQKPGGHAPLHVSGNGKLFLADKSCEELEAIISTKGLKRFTDNTITTYTDLCKELELVRSRGYAFDNEESGPGVVSVAAPIRDYSGRIVYGVSVPGPAARMTPEKIKKIIPHLLKTADSISRILGKENGAEK